MEKKVYFGLCPTEAAKSDKVVYLQGFESIPEFEEGDLLTVHFADKSETETVKLFMSTDDIGDSSPTTDSGNSAKMCGVEPIGIEGWDFVNAWEAGETKQFVYISRPDGNDTTGPYETYWLILDGGNATSDLYGDTKLFNQLTAAWLKEAPGDDEEITAITPATIRALFQGDESSEEDTLQLIWSQDSNEFDPESDIFLGDMCLSTRLDDPQEIYIPKDSIQTIISQIIQSIPIIEKTSDIPINDGESPNDDYYYIENYESDPVIFSGGLTVGLTVSSPNSFDLRVIDTGKIPNLITSEIQDITGQPAIHTNDEGDLKIGISGQPVKIYGNTLTLDPTDSGNEVIVSGGISTSANIYEKNGYLKDKYSGKLQVITFDYGEIKVGPSSSPSGRYKRLDKRVITNIPSGYTALGIVGYDLGVDDSGPHGLNLWECCLADNKTKLQIAVTNILNKELTIKHNLFYILCVKTIV